MRCSTALGLVARRVLRRDQPGFARTTTETIQRSRYHPAIAFEVGNTASDHVDFIVFAAGNPVTVARMGEAKHHDMSIALQNFAAAGGLVTFANEVPLGHCCSPFLRRLSYESAPLLTMDIADSE
ncbi:hypothetical protein D3C84_704110 [compost metagenome]